MGTNKSLLSLNGKPMIQWVLESLSSVFEKVVIASDHEADYRFLRLTIIPDLVKNSGPLGGIHAALVHSAPNPIFVLPCDMPYVPPDAIQSILAHQSRAPARVVTGEGRIFPLCGVYDQRALKFITTALRAGNLRMTDLIRSMNADLIQLPGDPRVVLNVNTPADYAV